MSSRLACAALLAAGVVAVPAAAAPQPEFVPLRAKNSAKSSRVEKPAPIPRVPAPTMAEMQGEIDADGRLRLKCDDLRHRHTDVDAKPERQR